MAAPEITELQLGKFLQIAYSEGIRTQISQDYQDWEMIKKVRAGNPEGRQLNFLLQKSLGPAAVQYMAANSSGAFPKAQQINTSEHSATYKEIASTIELEYSMWDRARKTPKKYAEPLAREIESKTTAQKRRLAADLYGDGTGAVVKYASAVASGNQIVITVDATDSAGHVGFAEYDDLLIVCGDSVSTALSLTAHGSTAALKVVSRSRKLKTVTVQPVTAAGVDVTGQAANIISDIVALGANHLYRYGQPTLPNRSAIVDYGNATEVMTGLKSLASDDGRTVHGITMSGSTSATTFDAASAAIDTSMIEEVMSDVKVQVGQSKYKYKQMVMAPERLSQLITVNETDRRFQTRDNLQRGSKDFGYQHGQDFMVAVTSEYVALDDVFFLPETSSGEKVLEFWGTDFEAVSAQGGSQFMLKPSADGGFERKITSFMQAYVCMICKHPAAIARIKKLAV